LRIHLPITEHCIHLPFCKYSKCLEYSPETPCRKSTPRTTHHQLISELSFQRDRKSAISTGDSRRSAPSARAASIKRSSHKFLCASVRLGDAWCSSLIAVLTIPRIFQSIHSLQKRPAQVISISAQKLSYAAQMHFRHRVVGE
jgi:hypothetical protein